MPEKKAGLKAYFEAKARQFAATEYPADAGGAGRRQATLARSVRGGLRPRQPYRAPPTPCCCRSAMQLLVRPLAADRPASWAAKSRIALATGLSHAECRRPDRQPVGDVASTN
jgi:hypothetical protein